MSNSWLERPGIHHAAVLCGSRYTPGGRAVETQLDELLIQGFDSRGAVQGSGFNSLSWMMGHRVRFPGCINRVQFPQSVDLWGTGFDSLIRWFLALLKVSRALSTDEHHHLKVTHDDMVLETVREEEDQFILETVYSPSMIWPTVNDTREIEMVLLECNSRHLKQAEIEEGRCHDETIKRMRENHGTDLMNEVLNGTIEIPEATDEIIVAWIQAQRQTRS
eukprot:scaffold5449_cov52-Cyclotella_meneghiniana.AAC.6